MKSDAQKYMSELKTLLPVKRADEKRFLSNISQDIEEFRLQNESATYEQICNEFGAPQSLVLSYFESVDSSVLVRTIRIRTFIRKICIAVLVTICIVCFVKSILLFKAYKYILESQPAYYTETID